MVSTQDRTRPLEELIAWSAPLLELDEGHERTRKEFIDIAGHNSPNKTYDLVESIARIRGFAPSEAEELARAARWLAIILRDYDQQAFDDAVAGKR